MMGRVSERLSCSLSPALRYDDANPVQAKASGIWPSLGSTGYPSTTLPPCFSTYFTAALRSSTVTPFRRNDLLTNRHTTDQTGSSSIRLRTRERSSTGNRSLGATEHHPTGCPSA